jgi:hypothetical protein
MLSLKLHILICIVVIWLAIPLVRTIKSAELASRAREFEMEISPSGDHASESYPSIVDSKSYPSPDMKTLLESLQSSIAVSMPYPANDTGTIAGSCPSMKLMIVSNSSVSYDVSILVEIWNHGRQIHAYDLLQTILASLQPKNLSLRLPNHSLTRGMNDLYIITTLLINEVVLSRSEIRRSMYYPSFPEPNLNAFLEVINARPEQKIFHSYLLIGVDDCAIAPFMTLNPRRLHVLRMQSAVQSKSLFCDQDTDRRVGSSSAIITREDLAVESASIEDFSVAALKAVVNTDFSIIYLDHFFDDQEAYTNAYSSAGDLSAQATDNYNYSKIVDRVAEIIQLAASKARKAIYLLVSLHCKHYRLIQEHITSISSPIGGQYQAFLFSRDVGPAGILVASTNHVLPSLELYSLSTGLFHRRDLDIDLCLRDRSHHPACQRPPRWKRHDLQVEDAVVEQRFSEISSSIEHPSSLTLSNSCLMRFEGYLVDSMVPCYAIVIFTHSNSSSKESLVKSLSDTMMRNPIPVNILVMNEAEDADVLMMKRSWRWFMASSTLLVFRSDLTIRSINEGVLSNATRVILGDVLSNEMHEDLIDEMQHRFDSSSNGLQPAIYNLDHIFPAMHHPSNFYSHLHLPSNPSIALPDGICFERLILPTTIPRI